MAKHSGKLTKRVVDAWEGTEGDLVLWDGKLSGFGVKALRNGAKSFVLNYRNSFGRDAAILALGRSAQIFRINSRYTQR